VGLNHGSHGSASPVLVGIARDPAVRHVCGGAGVAVLIPCRNEVATVGAVISAVRAVLPEAVLVVIDDGSSDGTDRAAEAAGAQVVRLRPGRGYGAALKAGAAVVLADRGVHTLATIDGDGTYAADDLARLVQLHQAAHPPVSLTLGARRGLSDLRPLRAGLRGAIRTLGGPAGWGIPDVNTGLRVLDRALYERVAPLLSEGFSFSATSTLAAVRLGVTVASHPVGYSPRREGSKVRLLRDTARTAQSLWRVARAVGRA